LAASSCTSLGRSKPNLAGISKFFRPIGAPRELYRRQASRSLRRTNSSPQRIRVAGPNGFLLPSSNSFHQNRWAGGLRRAWKPGETGARENLEALLDGKLRDYATARDDLARASTSRLSPHLRFGEISPRQIFVIEHTAARTGAERGAEKFLSELSWREFNYHVLFHHGQQAVALSINQNHFNQLCKFVPRLSDA
jgi:deoxyribodipyrimidine photolyase